MTNLRWLRSRIWIALALPGAVACHQADKGIAKPEVSNTASDGGPPPPPPTYAKWTLEDAGCGGDYWCMPRTGECAQEYTIPQTADGPPAGTWTAYTEGDRCCIDVPPAGGSCEGRPFLDGRRKVVAQSEVAARGWAAMALGEHASIASFARATLELMAVGAPPALIAGCQRAALDEIAHAQGCFAIAARRGCGVEPGPIEALAPRGGGLAAVARDTFLEGCVGETIGALAASDARDACSDPDERALLARIADDEARHAELAWKTVAWALSRDSSIAAELRVVADRARDDSAVWRDVIDPTLLALIMTARPPQRLGA